MSYFASTKYQLKMFNDIQASIFHVFDVQLSIWQLRSCLTDGVENVLIISHLYI